MTTVSILDECDAIRIAKTTITANSAGSTYNHFQLRFMKCFQFGNRQSQMYYQCQICSQAPIQSLPLLTTFSGSTNSTPWRPLKSLALSTVLRSTVMVVGFFGT